MAWIPSHQELRDHPKTRRCALILGIPRAHLIGHLHCLWWWAFAYAPDGNVTKFDDVDLALAAEWEGEAAAFVDALRSCGSGGGPGFLDGNNLHDWSEYAGKYVEKRRRDAGRKRDERSTSEGEAQDGAGTSTPVPSDIHGTSDGHPTDAAQRPSAVAGRGEERRGDGGDAPPPDKPTASPAVPIKEATKRKMRLPDSWEPAASHKRLAVEHRLDLSREVARFRDHHLAKGSLMLDWNRAFNTWLSNAVERGWGARATGTTGPTMPKYREGD